MPRSGYLFLLASVAAIGGLLYWIATAPAYSFNPFCTYGEIYRLDGVIEVNGTRYSSHVIRQTTRSRRWIEAINYAGCKSTHGTALAFRLNDDRVVLLRSMICGNARRALTKGAAIDVTAYCDAMDRNKSRRVRDTSSYPEAFLVDHAERPGNWWPVYFGKPVADSGTVIRLVSLTAAQASGNAWDDLDKAAPGLLQATFAYRHSWHQSPDSIVTFDRRREYYDAHKTFRYRVENRGAAGR